VLPALPHDAVTLLEKDHRRFEQLLEEGEGTTARARKRRNDVLSTLAAEIVTHERKEEQVLYPALKRHREARDIVLEGYQEHHVADVLVGELKNMDPADERWGAKFKVLKESLEHHIEEEEGHMFRTARSVLGRDRLEQLGRRMQAMNGRRRVRAD
jgi:hemerythrin-like domain-containing protein